MRDVYETEMPVHTDLCVDGSGVEIIAIIGVEGDSAACEE